MSQVRMLLGTILETVDSVTQKSWRLLIQTHASLNTFEELEKAIVI